MERATRQKQCVTCQKERTTAKCNGCLKDYCYNHLGEHREELKKRIRIYRKSNKSFTTNSFRTKYQFRKTSII